MKTLADHLLATRTPAELARELAALAKERCALVDKVGALEHEAFWRDVKEHAEISRLKREVEWLQGNLIDAQWRVILKTT